MACADCSKQTQAVCDACSLVFGDNRFKKCVYCPKCKAWICEDCDNNWLVRGVAYFLRKINNRFKKKLPDSK